MLNEYNVWKNSRARRYDLLGEAQQARLAEQALAASRPQGPARPRWRAFVGFALAALRPARKQVDGSSS